MKVWQKNLILIVLVVLLAALPLWLLPDAEFGGADGQAEEAILELQPVPRSSRSTIPLHT